MRTPITATLSCITLYILVGCSSQIAGSGEDIRPVWQPMTCEEEVDCPDGRNCQHGLCVDGPKNVERTLSASIQPPPDRSDLSPLTFRGVTLSNDNAITMTMPRMISVHGEVLQESSQRDRILQLYFSRKDDIPGRGFSTSTTTNALGQFSVQLPAGNYTVSMRTESDDLPAHSSKIEIREETEGSMIHLKFPAMNQYIRWSGRLVRLDDNHITQPIDGVTIWATDPSTSDRSSITTTDKNGNFSFYMDRDVTTFEVQVRGTAIEINGQSYHVPTTTFTPYKVVLDESSGDAQQLPGSELLIGQLRPDTTIRGIVVDSGGERVAGVTVLAQARIRVDEQVSEEKSSIQDFLSPVRATMSEHTLTESDGSFELSFPSMDNVQLSAIDTTHILRVSGIGDALGVNDLATSIELILQDPLSIDLDIVDNNGNAVEYFDLQFEIIDNTLLSPRDYDTSQSQLNSTYQVSADRALHIQQPSAAWSIGIKPRLDLTLPNTWITHLLTPESTTIQARIPQGIAAAFLIEDDKGEPIRGATIELWDEDLQAVTNTPQLLGTAQTNSNGHAAIIVPYEPPQEN